MSRCIGRARRDGRSFRRGPSYAMAFTSSMTTAARYVVALEFENRAVSEAFSRAVWSVVLAEHPELQEEVAA